MTLESSPTRPRFSDGRRYKGRYQEEAIDFFESINEDTRFVLIDSVTVKKNPGKGYTLVYWVAQKDASGTADPERKPDRRTTYVNQVPLWVDYNSRTQEEVGGK